MEHHSTIMQYVWFGVFLVLQCIVIAGGCAWSHQKEQERLNALFPRTKGDDREG